ncbi:protein UXT homolog isoform X1 [Vigna radiata var. radiata]|uniref:Protein UXT homolog isoform X1 n=1 Tax=Vigna radiata var. radiata TaxID=3916 RepID=A0A3Q0EU32_VIGRR|nr:protein UXT homolog isoform X1 [Vigna radiata var. radiata]XP_022633965.1 protein UXT homolog isoform X1 [Vigna radiata var. radiata]XP_022633966.1 protein UXT homolog isoform X1 [Vigna radiata var. radiata]XP_022633967.1 protein UXT homolog isoform X1 [Vigna radiata var. radiata]XP_022633968.1 protein UXT homolog isoform X1 [Vigna radiata var. radiata]XP_022633969.1 protein UXT homolog isoform X1 [Vigna radiata var. radiata]
MEDNARQEKVRKYEEFVDKRLKPDLIHAISQRDKVFEQQKIFSDLRRNIENLEKNSVTSLRTLVNLGSEVYLQAEVPDTQRIFVDIGFGFHVEFTWSEALNYIEKREEKIARFVKGFENYFNFQLRKPYQSGYFDIYQIYTKLLMSLAVIQRCKEEMLNKNKD